MTDFSATHGVPGDDYQELRLALVLNGGVSLAIWISGVVREIDRLVRSDSTYRDLQELTAARASVDVISGASAGGVNGVMLALGLARDVELGLLRPLWLDHGDFDKLLRDPFEKEPPSLLSGSYFMDRLRDALQKIYEQGSAPPAGIPPAAQAPIDLTVTVTLLNGDKKCLHDDFGTLIEEVEHRGQLRFRRQRNGTDDPFTDPRIVDRLALAARATAGFPGAFEPLFCPVGVEPSDRGLPDMGSFSSFRGSRFLIDGGTLDNKPMEWALDAVFRQRAENEVRRVLAYVIPDPGETTTEEPDAPGAPPLLGNVVAASLVTMPRVETVTAQLAQIIEHNRLVREKRDTRLALAGLEYHQVYDLACKLFPVYQAQRRHSAVERITDAVIAGVIEHEHETSNTRARRFGGRREREWLARRLLQPASAPWIPGALPPRDQAPDAASWTWGTFTVQTIAEIALYVLDRALRCTPLEDTATREALKLQRSEAYDAIAALPIDRDRGERFWRQRGHELAACGALAQESSKRQALVDAWVTASFQAWRPIEGLGPLAYRLAGILVSAAALARPVLALGTSPVGPQGREHRARLGQLLDYLVPPDQCPPEQILARLLALQVTQFAVGGKDEVRDQFVELLQIDANGRGPYGSVERAREKLAGMGLSHFGAFYKRSWRASDWMHGRLDGSSRLVRMLLDPGRLQRLYHQNPRVQGSAAAYVAGLIEQLAVPQGLEAEDRAFLDDQWKRREIERELAFLDNPEAPVPEALPAATQAILRRMHLEILRQELPLVLEEEAADHRRGRAPRRAAHAGDRDAPPRSAGAVHRPRDIVTGFTRHTAEMKGIQDDAGSDRFTHLVTRASAVLVSALASKHSGLGGARRGLEALRVPMLVLYVLVQTALHRSRTYATIYVASFTIVVVALFTASKLPDLLGNGAGLVLWVLTAIELLRRGVLLVVWLVGFPMLWIIAERGRWLIDAFQDLWQRLMS